MVVVVEASSSGHAESDMMYVYMYVCVYVLKGMNVTKSVAMKKEDGSTKVEFEEEKDQLLKELLYALTFELIRLFLLIKTLGFGTDRPEQPQNATYYTRDIYLRKHEDG